MKNILFTLALLISFSSFGQRDVAQLIKVAKMDIEKFEMYALENGYSLDEFMDDEDVKGLSMSKGTGDSTEYLTVYSKFYKKRYQSGYQCKKEKLIYIYRELKKMGFKLINSENETIEGRGAYVKYYKRAEKEILNIYNINSKDNVIELEYGMLY